MKKLIFLLLIFILYGCQKAERPEQEYDSKLFWDNLHKLQAQEPNTSNTPYKFDFDAIEARFAQKQKQPVPHYFNNSPLSQNQIDRLNQLQLSYENQIYRQQQLELMRQLVEQQKQLVEQQRQQRKSNWADKWWLQQQNDFSCQQQFSTMFPHFWDNNCDPPSSYEPIPAFKPKMWWEY